MKLSQVLAQGLALDALCLASLSLVASAQSLSSSAQSDLSSANGTELESSSSGSIRPERASERREAQPEREVPAPVPSRNLMGSLRSISLSEGGVLELQLNAGEVHAGSFYAMFGSAEADASGIWLSEDVMLPLVADPYFLTTALRPFSPVFRGYRGRLDRDGQASASLTIPEDSDPSLIGVTLYHAYAVSDGSDWVFASRSVPLTLEP